MNEKHRHFIQLMIEKEPNERVKMAFVVDKLGEFVRDKERECGQAKSKKHHMAPS